MPPEKKSPLKAMTLKRPMAPAVVAGLKTIECRSWNMRHRGDIAIHYGRGSFPRAERADAYSELENYAIDLNVGAGCVIAVATVVDVVPMLRPPAVPRKAIAGPEPGLYVTDEHLTLRTTHGGTGPRGGGTPTRRLDAQRPFGTFEPGWFAIILDDVRELPEPVLCRGGQTVFNLPIQVEARVRDQLT